MSDQPDVFETEGNKSETSDYYEEEPENENIERFHLDPFKYYKSFQAKTISEAPVDFSDSISRKGSRRGFDLRWDHQFFNKNFISKNSNFFRSSEYQTELGGYGEKESPLERCNRLQAEINDFINEMTVLQSDSSVPKDDKQEYEAITNIVDSSKKLLEGLRQELVLGKETTSKTADSDIKNLIRDVEGYKIGANSSIRVMTDNDLARTTRIAELEHRLYELESVIGAKPDKLSRLASSLGTTNLLEAVQQISTKAAMLQPQQLDIIEGRLTTIAAKMDAINEKTSGSAQDPAREQKISELYELAKATEPVVPILPDLLQRMQALEALHKYGNFFNSPNLEFYENWNFLAANFTKLFAELEATQSNILNGVSNNKALLDGVQEAFAVNLESINEQVKRLEDRVQKISIPKK